MTKHKSSEIAELAKDLLEHYMAVMDDAIKTGDIGKLNLQKAEEKKLAEENQAAGEKEGTAIKTEDNASTETKAAEPAKENGSSSAVKSVDIKTEVKEEVTPTSSDSHAPEVCDSLPFKIKALMYSLCTGQTS